MKQSSREKIKKRILDKKIVREQDVFLYEELEELREEIEEKLKVVDELLKSDKIFKDLFYSARGVKSSGDNLLDDLVEYIKKDSSFVESLIGKDGSDGKDAIVDYDFILKEILKNIRQPKDGQTPIIDYQKIIAKVLAEIPMPDTSKIALEASNKAVAELLPKIPTIPQLIENIPMEGEKVRDSLELLDGEDRLDITAIKGLDNFKEIDAFIKNPASLIGKYGVGGSTARNFYQLQDTPSGYAGQSGKALRVNTGETGLEFYSAAGGHDAVTLDANAGALLGLTGQELGLDTQTSNRVFAGPASGAAAVPTFRALVAGDIPDISSTYAAVAQTFYIGTTQVAINRASAALTLAGITLTTPDIGTPSAGTLTNCTGLPLSGVIGGAAGANAYDFGGATSLEIPNGAGGTTVDSAGELCIDTTSKTLNFFDGVSEVVLNPIKSKSIIIETPVATDDMPLWRADVGVTILEVAYLCIGGTNWVGQLQECDANGINGADTQAADTTASAGTTSDVTSFSNASIDAGDWVGIKTTSISGTPTRLHVTFYYSENP